MTHAAKRLLSGLFAAAALTCAAAAQEVVAVVSSPPGPYEAAYAGFQRNFGSPVAVYHLPGEKPAIGPRTRVVVAFGGEAVVLPYPKRVTVIACLAPGVPDYYIRQGSFAFVAMKPQASALLAQMQKLQPKLKRLAVLWNTDITGRYLEELRGIAGAQGIETELVRVADVSGLPDALRSLSPKPDALWLAPDPTLVTPESFQTIKQFSWDSGIPFYAPTSGLAAAGAAAAVSISASETGRAAATLALRALAGTPLPEISYVENAELTVNRQSSAKSGLVLTPEVLSRADKVLP
ncbi:MAG: ABC transporter substrate binding protein [Elusimicrobiota bacterium]